MIFFYSYSGMANLLDLLVIDFIRLSMLAVGNNEKKLDKLRDVAAGFTKSFLGEATPFTAGEQGFFKKHTISVSFKNNDSGSPSFRNFLTKKVCLTPIVNFEPMRNIYLNGITVIQ